jgi:CDP-diglyceride synthetase
MFKTRLISGIILMVIALYTIISGGTILFATLLAISLIGIDEIFRAMKIVDNNSVLLRLASYLTIVAYYLIMYFELSEYQLPVLMIGLVINMFVYVFSYPKYNAGQIMAAFFGIVYVGVMLSFIYQTRLLAGGNFHVWLIFLCSWGCDTCAYCAGVTLGKHKMAPVLSPKKSIEGAIGGVLGAALLGGIYAAIIDEKIMEYVIICAIGALIAMVGDLAASAIKRNQDIKDYGSLIPGHGGILDRFDSVIFVAPIIFILSRLLLVQ